MKNKNLHPGMKENDSENQRWMYIHISAAARAEKVRWDNLVTRRGALCPRGAYFRHWRVSVLIGRNLMRVEQDPSHPEGSLPLGGMKFTIVRRCGAILRSETYCQSTPPLGTRGAPSAQMGRQGGGYGPNGYPLNALLLFYLNYYTFSIGCKEYSS